MYRIILENYKKNNVISERKPKITSQAYERFQKLYSDLRNTNGFNFINFYDNGWEQGRKRSGMCNLITTDGSLQIHIVLSFENVVKLKLIYNNEENGLGENVINRIQNLCQKYDFHLELYASPIHLSGEFNFLRDNPTGRYIKEFYGFMVSNPYVKKTFKKYLRGLQNYLKTTDRKTLESILGLVKYYKKFGFVVLPFSLEGFLCEGRITRFSGLHMCWFNPNLDLKTTYPFWSDKCYSQCGSVKRLFTWKQSVEFVNWVIDNERFDLIGRNDDFFKAMLLMDLQFVQRYEDENTPDDEKKLMKKLMDLRNDEHGYSYSSEMSKYATAMIDEGINIFRNIRRVGIQIPKNFYGLKPLTKSNNSFLAKFLTTSPEEDILKGLI